MSLQIMERVTMGELASWEPPPEEGESFRRFVKALDDFFPGQWRLWETNKMTFDEVFGEKISTDDECRLRFAVPTVELARAFSSNQSLSERRYKAIKRVLVTWPLGRATIYTPFATMKKLHPEEAFNGFWATVSELKPYFISRTEADKQLRKANLSPSTSSGYQGKRPHSPTPSNESKRRRDTDGPILKLMMQQNSIMEQLSESIKSIQNQIASRDQCHESGRDQCHVTDSDESSEEGSWTAPSFNHGDGAASLVPEEQETNAEDVFLDFAPETKESEAKISSADENLAQQGSQCQRLGLESWQNIRYSEVQKKFQAAPVFTSLKTNSNLATVTPQWQLVSILERMDLCLGAITHGLLQQRKEFQDIYQKSSLEVKRAISTNFLTTDASFRRTSDALLQYTCGKRAEVIHQRRSIYKPQNKVLNELLHSIPPSSTHLFSEPQLSGLVKEQGGINKFFPGKTKFRQKPKSKEAPHQPYRQGSKEKSRAPDSYRRQNYKPQDRSQASSGRPGNKQTNSRPRRAKFEARKF